MKTVIFMFIKYCGSLVFVLPSFLSASATRPRVRKSADCRCTRFANLAIRTLPDIRSPGSQLRSQITRSQVRSSQLTLDLLVPSTRLTGTGPK